MKKSSYLLIIVLLLTGQAWGQGTITPGGKISTAAPAAPSYINFNNTLRNTSVGYLSGQAYTTGNYNAAFGSYALNANTTGYYNTAVGDAALTLNTEGYYNTAVGGAALAHNTTGICNHAFGESALTTNTTGSYNYGFGAAALSMNTTGNGNIAMGDTAMNLNVTGSENTSIGDASMYHNLASQNSAYGSSALHNNTTGTNNAGFGWRVLNTNTTGANNAAFGADALFSNSTGAGNVALGYCAGRYETGSSAFYVDNQDRTNTANDKAQALLYGVFNANPQLQTLTANARLGIGTVPAYRFHVKGDGLDANSTIMAVQCLNNGEVMRLSFLAASGTLMGGMTGNSSTGEVQAGGFLTGAFPTFYSNNAEAMRINTSGNVGINTGATINAAALLQMTSTTKGFLAPVMTTAQRAAISTPPEGLQVYDSTLHTMCFYNGTNWQKVTSSNAD